MDDPTAPDLDHYARKKPQSTASEQQGQGIR